MDTALFVGLAHKSALRRRMDVVSNNIANMSTTAFKKERVAFKEFLMDAPGAAATEGGKVSYMLDYGVLRNLEQGQMIPTDNPLDVFINGRGYITVEGADGDTLYTRNGRMKLDNDNNLALLSGEKVLDETGQPFFFDPEEKDIHIADDGTVSSDIDVKGRIALVTFENEQAMKRRGNSLYETDENPIEPENAIEVRLKTKAVEGSNVNAIQSMVEMIDVSRAYQRAIRSDKSYEDMRKDSLDRLARVQ